MRLKPFSRRLFKFFNTIQDYLKKKYSNSLIHYYDELAAITIANIIVFIEKYCRKYYFKIFHLIQYQSVYLKQKLLNYKSNFNLITS